MSAQTTQLLSIGQPDLSTDSVHKPVDRTYLQNLNVCAPAFSLRWQRPRTLNRLTGLRRNASQKRIAFDLTDERSGRSGTTGKDA
jgi:hypothetical protein